MIHNNILADKPTNERIDFVAIALAVLFMRTVFIAFMNTLSLQFSFETDTTSYIYYGLIWSLFLIGVFRNGAHTSFSFVLFVVILLLLAGFNLVMNNNIYIWNVTLQDFVTFGCYSFLHGVSYLIFIAFLNSLRQFRFFLHLFSFVFMFAVPINDILTISSGLKYLDDMMYSYGVCVLTCTLLYEFLERRNIFDLVLSVVGFISMFISGSRGPLVCVFVELFIWLIINTQKHKISYIILLVIIVLFSTGRHNDMISGLGSVLSGFGVNDLRILQFQEDNMLLDNSGRDFYYQMTLDKISANPFIGNGIGGDRTSSGSYVHNIVLEILCDFGIVLGSVFVIYLINMFRKFFTSDNKDLAAIGLILFSSFIVGLFFSSSYLIIYEFFIVIGLYLNNKSITQSHI